MVYICSATEVKRMKVYCIVLYCIVLYCIVLLFLLLLLLSLLLFRFLFCSQLPKRTLVYNGETV